MVLNVLRRRQTPRVVWFTGLSAAGKTSIAGALNLALDAQGFATCLLDGDHLRQGLCADLGFSPQDRAENVRRVGEVARLMADAGLIVLASLISPVRAERDRVRRLFEPGTFVEVFVDTPLQVCEARDPKGFYKRARAGAIAEFTGISAPYEPPLSPELTLHTQGRTPADCAREVIDHLRLAPPAAGPD